LGGLFKRKYRDEKGALREGEKWWIKFYRNGREYRESSGSEKKTDAIRLLKLREGQIVEGKFHGLQVERITFDEIGQDLLNDYRMNGKKSLAYAERAAGRLRKFFSGYRAKEITTDMIKKYISERKEQLAANGTINRELAFLKRAFSLAVKSEKLDRAPYIPKLAENNVRQFFFEHEDYLKLKAALPEHLIPVIVLAYHSGMRREEMLSLTWNKVDLVSGRIILAVGSTKNKEGRIIPLAGDLYEVLAHQKQTTEEQYPGCPYVFHYRGQRIRDSREAWETALQKCGFKPTYLCRVCGAVSEFPIGADRQKQKRVKVNGKTVKTREQEGGPLLCQECGSDKLRRHGRVLHDFRRSAVRNMVRSGVPESICMKLSGHKTREIFSRYNITNEADLDAATAKIMEYHRQMGEQIERRKPYVAGPDTGSISGSSSGQEEKGEIIHGECGGKEPVKSKDVVPLTGIEPVRQLPVERF